MKFRKKPVVIDAITFDELVQHGRENGGNIVDGMPWSFTYKGHPISHERDDCYLIPTLEGTHNFTKEDMLITGVKGEIYPCKKDIFEATYDPAEYESENPLFRGEPLRFDPVEQEIQAKGLTAPRVTQADIEDNIASEHYFTAEDGVGRASRGQTSVGGKNPVALSLLTFCVIVLRNGFTVTGESACASPENFDAEIGRKIARQNAVQKIWPLMGYELRTQLSRPVLTDSDALADLNGTRRPDNYVK